MAMFNSQVSSELAKCIQDAAGKAMFSPREMLPPLPPGFVLESDDWTPVATIHDEDALEALRVVVSSLGEVAGTRLSFIANELYAVSRHTPS